MVVFGCPINSALYKGIGVISVFFLFCFYNQFWKVDFCILSLTILILLFLLKKNLHSVSNIRERLFGECREGNVNMMPLQ